MESEIEMKKVDIPVDVQAGTAGEATSQSESSVLDNTNELELKMSPTEVESKEETVGTMNSFGVILMEWFDR